MKYEYVSRVPNIAVVDYSINVPFHRTCTICEHTLITADVLTPIQGPGYIGELYPVPSYQAIYRLIGDGIASPTFASPFKQTSISENFVNTAGVLNLITFLFDGADYWYTIVQDAASLVTTTAAPTTTAVVTTTSAPTTTAVVTTTSAPTTTLLATTP
jgi:hypothetical protein